MRYMVVSSRRLPSEPFKFSAGNKKELAMKSLLYIGIPLFATVGGAALGNVISLLKRATEQNERLLRTALHELSPILGKIEDALSERKMPQSPMGSYSDRYYYLSHESVVEGPYTATDLRVLLLSGDVDDETLAFRAGEDSWSPISDFV